MISMWEVNKMNQLLSIEYFKLINIALIRHYPMQMPKHMRKAVFNDLT